MKRLAIITALALGFSAVPSFAQAPAAPAAPAPAAAQAPAAAPAPAPAAQPPAPFPVGAKYAYVNLPALFQLTRDGKAATAKIQNATTAKQKDIESKAKALQANQQKLEAGGTVMTEAARLTLQREIDRQQREGERLELAAQQELTEMQQEVQAEFQTKLLPILEQLSKDKGLHMLFSAVDAGLVWADPGLDLTAEAIKRLDATPATPAK
jgi:Skp family chaperone for outer membrane proteins